MHNPEKKKLYFVGWKDKWPLAHNVRAIINMFGIHVKVIVPSESSLGVIEVSGSDAEMLYPILKDEISRYYNIVNEPLEINGHN